MINFFSKIRHGLANNNQFFKYSRYAIGEIALVMIGILLALQVNNWNENRKIVETRNTIYQNLLQDLKTDSKYIDKMIEELNFGIKLHEEYLSTFETPNLTMDDVLNNQNKLDFVTTTMRFQNSTVSTLENTGEIKLIPSDLRKKLIDFNRDQLYLVETNNQWNNNYFDRIENAGIYGSQPYFQNRIKNQPLLRDKLGVKDNLDKIIWSIEIAMFYKKMNEQNVLSNLKKLKSDISEIVEIINGEIKE